MENDFYTLRRLAEAAGCHESRVRYVLSSRSIDPAFRIAGVRVFDREQATRIFRELQATAARPARGRTKSSVAH